MNSNDNHKRVTRPATIIVGGRFENGREIAEIAKLVRADIKSAVASGALPAAKYSVRSERYSKGRSLCIIVSALDESFVIFNAKRLVFDAKNPHASHVGLPLDVLSLYSEQYDALRSSLEALADEYNRRVVSNEADDGDHVSFHLDVNVDSDCRVNARDRETAAALAMLQARTAPDGIIDEEYPEAQLFNADTLPAPTLAASDVETVLAVVLAQDIADDASHVSFLSHLGVL